jgi:hypothetical protein
LPLALLAVNALQHRSLGGERREVGRVGRAAEDLVEFFVFFEHNEGSLPAELTEDCLGPARVTELVAHPEPSRTGTVAWRVRPPPPEGGSL